MIALNGAQVRFPQHSDCYKSKCINNVLRREILQFHLWSWYPQNIKTEKKKNQKKQKPFYRKSRILISRSNMCVRKSFSTFSPAKTSQNVTSINLLNLRQIILRLTRCFDIIHGNETGWLNTYLNNSTLKNLKKQLSRRVQAQI